jgi:hypothetical protein
MKFPIAGGKFLELFVSLQKKLPNVGQLSVLHDASMYYLIISKLLFTKAVNASPLVLR